MLVRQLTTTLLSELIMTQLRKKTYCYLFTINRIETPQDFYSIFLFFHSFTRYLVLGLEPKEKIGSQHIQGCLVLNSDIKFYQIQDKIKKFLKNLDKNPSIYFQKVENPNDLPRCTKYCTKKKKSLIKIKNKIIIINNNTQYYYPII